MSKKAKAVAAIALSSVFACGLFSGCEFVTTNTSKDFSQVVAEIDITKNAEFAPGGEFSEYGDVIAKSEILKRDLVAAFVSYGSTYVQYYGYSYMDTFNSICQSLVAQQIKVQYAMAYLMKHGDAEGNTYSMAGYNAAIADQSDKQLAGLRYFLTETEQKQGLYATRLRFNNVFDSTETAIINESSDSSSSSVTVRTLPTGVDTANSDYYDEAYKIYTGVNSASNCGSYKTVSGSSVVTRKKAFDRFLGQLRENDLLSNGEDPSDFESLSYFNLELRTQYETMIANKLTALFEKEDEATIENAWVAEQFENDYASQSEQYKANVSSFESSLDSISNSEFILTAPEEGYGYVINILLPFSSAQSDKLSNAPQDQGDPKGNNFMQRTSLLKNILATDQRASWITGETDHSFNASESGSSVTAYYNAGNAARTHLFFEDGLIKDYSSAYFAQANNVNYKNYTEEYSPLANYYGRYSFNGSVQYFKDEDAYRIVENKISIDDFITELNGYMNYSFKQVFNRDAVSSGEYVFNNYYTRNYYDYYTLKEDASAPKTKDNVDYNTVDYESFLYYSGKVTFENGFDANKMFLAGSEENLAYSVINELSFAYNTDTAGLNPYLGYSVVTGKTSYMTEFEYAAQIACKNGAGSYVIVPTDYGWHFIYCTFSFLENDAGEIKPFTFNENDIETKGTFSNLYYELWKSKSVSLYSTNKNTLVDNTFNNDTCVTIYESRYANFAELDNA